MNSDQYNFQGGTVLSFKVKGCSINYHPIYFQFRGLNTGNFGHTSYLVAGNAFHHLSVSGKLWPMCYQPQMNIYYH